MTKQTMIISVSLLYDYLPTGPSTDPKSFKTSDPKPDYSAGFLASSPPLSFARKHRRSALSMQSNFNVYAQTNASFALITLLLQTPF